MNYAYYIEQVLLEESLSGTLQLFDDLLSGASLTAIGQSLANHPRLHPVRPTKPSWQNFCQVVGPGEVPRRTNLDQIEGQRNLLHAVCHIEYSAFELALDTVYRYPGLPAEFYTDFLQTAQEELDHFKMVRVLLIETGSDYGQLPVHNSLWEGAMACKNVLERLAILPRYQEANGLEANARIIKKLGRMAHPFCKKILTAFEQIYTDEIVHVRRGSHWFRFECQRQKMPEDYFFTILDAHFPNRAQARQVDGPARLQAGFSPAEIQRLNQEPF